MPKLYLPSGGIAAREREECAVPPDTPLVTAPVPDHRRPVRPPWRWRRCLWRCRPRRTIPGRARRQWLIIVVRMRLAGAESQGGETQGACDPGRCRDFAEIHRELKPLLSK